MKNNVKKYGLMTIAAVLLVALAFAGAASADNWTDANNFNATWYEDEGGDSPVGDTYHIYDARSLAALSEKVTLNATPVEFDGKTILIMNDIDLAGHVWTPIGNSSYEFSGIIDGNYHEISNFNISYTWSHAGLFGNYTGTRIANLTISNFSVSGSFGVGGLVAGRCSANECTFENVSAKFGTVTGSIAKFGTFPGSIGVGGLVGLAYVAGLKIQNCTAENCIIASSDSSYMNGYVGGLVGYAYSASFDVCKVVNCSVSGGIGVGGLVGVADNASGSVFMRGCNVTNCIVSSGSGGVGGLVGGADSASSKGFTACVVKDSTIVSSGSYYVGGLVGGADSASVFNAGNWVNDSAVRGNNSGYDFVGEVVGCDNGSKKNIADCSGNVTSDGSIWLNNNSNANYPKIYIAKDPVKQGLENSTNFNEGVTASSVPKGAKLVTQLTGYGQNGKYAALGYVYEPPTLYGITITNATGTYPLTSVLTTVCGDYGMANGTAVLTNESGNLVLTLDGFTASNMSGVPIINASVPDLTIVLNGESNLTGSYADNDDKGLLYSSGNLTIKGANDSSKLLVNNTRSGSSAAYVTAIHVVNDLTIDNAKVTVIANSYGIRYAYGLVSGNTVTITGSKTVVEANANNPSGFSISISAEEDIMIDSSAKVTAKSQACYYAHALSSRNDIFIGQNTVVVANANLTSNTAGYAYSISAGNDIKITSAAKVNATAETNGSSYKEAHGLHVSGGAITITDSPDVTATATLLNNPNNGCAYSITTWITPAIPTQGNAVAKNDIVITNSKVTAKAEGGTRAYALLSELGNITITGDKAVIDAAATCTNSASTNFAIAICALNDLTITSAKKIKAIGNYSSFAYNGSLYGSLNINKLADYKFSNASVDGDEPTLYATFVNSSNWHVAENNGYINGYIVSNYTAVLIEKNSPTPSYTSTPSKQTGYTVILQDTENPVDAADTSATMYVVNFSMNGHGIQVMNQSVSFGNTADEPSPVPTADGYTFTGWYTDKGLVSKYAFSTPVTDDIELYAGWTAKIPTSKSPVPFVGILAGLGAVAVVLRLRK